MCTKELYDSKYDPLSVSYTVLSGGEAFWNSCFNKRTVLLNPRTYMQIHTPTVVQVKGGRWVNETPPRSFWYVAVFWNDFNFSGKPSIFLTRWGMIHGWYCCRRPVTSPTMVVILVATLDLVPRIRNQDKTARNDIFCVLYLKNSTWINTLHDFSHNIYFYCWKNLKKHVFSPQTGLTTCYLWRHIS